MKRRSIGFYFLPALFIVTAGLATPAFAETDTVYWSEFSLEGGLSERLSVSIATDRRFREDGKQHYYTSTAMALNYAVLHWLEAGLGYKEVFKQKNNGWQQENRFYGQGAVKWKIGEWKFKNRLRAELRQKDGEADYYRFREKLTIKSPWKWTASEINPYVADEIFIEKKEREGFNENRVYAGIAMKLAEHVGLDLYYMYNIEKQDREWGGDRVNIIGTELNFTF